MFARLGRELEEGPMREDGTGLRMRVSSTEGSPVAIR